jgi:flavin reductase (DIM6/NTAB) family NADH-FMN oxidoreductase RutF
MTKIYISENELNALQETDPTRYTLGAPMPQALLVTPDPKLGNDSPNVRTVTITPLSWRPYTKAVSLPLQDRKVVEALQTPDAACVLGLPSREMLHAIRLCALEMPPGISEANVARLELHKSLFIDVPSINACPVNFECVVDHLETYHAHLIAFLRVVGASIDDGLLFMDREEIVTIYPTNAADEIVDEENITRMRVSLLHDLFLCPTFPVAPKQGWYSTFDRWMKDLCDDNYLDQDEYEKVVGWYARWQEIFPDLDAPERAQIRQRLTDLIRRIAKERWDEVHAFLSETGA